MLRVMTSLLAGLFAYKNQAPDPFMDVKALQVYPPINRPMQVAFKQKEPYAGFNPAFVEVIAITGTPLTLELLPEGKQLPHTGSERTDALYIRPLTGRSIKLRVLKAEEDDHGILLLVRYHEPVGVALMETRLYPELQPPRSGDLANNRAQWLDYKYWAATSGQTGTAQPPSPA